MKKLGLIIFFSLVFAFEAEAQTFQASVNRNPVPEGEAFVLKLSLKDASTASAPDVSVLKKDFNVYSVSNSSVINIVNQKRSEVKEWNITLIAKKSGNISIPSIKIDNLQTDPIVVNVVDAAAATDPVIIDEQKTADDASKPKFSMKAEVDQKNPFVQQQVNYTITLYDAGGLRGSEPRFIDNGQKDWIVKSIKAPTEEMKKINGKDYREIKFYYALFPQKSGVLEIPELRFEGYYLSNMRRAHDPFENLFGPSLAGTGFDFGDVFATRNPVSLMAEPIEISVKPIPPINNGHWWLPAKNVEIYSKWASENPQFRVGDAVSLDVFVKAEGVLDTQLPDIKFLKAEGLKQYPGKTTSESVVKDGRIISTKKIPIVYIPTQAGNVTIPEVSISWYDLESGKINKAVLAPIVLNILPGEGAAVLEQEKSDSFEKRSEDMSNVAQETVQLVEAEAVPGQYLYWLIALAFVLGAGFSYLTFRPIKKQIDEKKNIKNYPQFIKAKAKEKDLKALRDALIEWCAANNEGKIVDNLKDVAKYNPHKDFKSEIDKLMQTLYSDAPQEWDEKTFIKAFEQANDLAQIKKLDKAPIPKLYSK